MKHGTRTSYNHLGCRCDDCREAQNTYHRAWRARHRAENSPVYQKELATSRALKERYRGTCEDCGRPTTGCAGKDHAPRLCNRCAPAHNNQHLRGAGHMQRRALAYLQQERGYKELADLLGVPQSYMTQLLQRLMSHGFVERVARGRYIVADRAKVAA